MTFPTDRRRGLALGLIFLAAVIIVAVAGIIQLSQSPISVLLVVWVSLPVVMAPIAVFILYRLYGLLTSQYRLDRDGFYLEWGFSREQIPIHAIAGVYRSGEVARHLTPESGFWWPGCMVGRRELPGKGTVEFFATSDSEKLVVLRIGDRLLAISPSDPVKFNEAFIDATRMGSLSPIQPISRRPTFLTDILFADRYASLSLAIGLVVSFLVLGYLAVRIPTLPAEVAFGFAPDGSINSLVPPARLLLLPLISGFCWIGNVLVGVIFYRRERTRSLAYVLWAMSIVVGLLFGGAVIQLLSTS